MGRRIAVSTALSSILAIALFVFIVDDNDLPADLRTEVVASQAAGKAQSKASPKSKKGFSERKKRIKGLAKADRPDLFAQYHRDIRTRDGETAPSYKYNYQVHELRKAKKISSTKYLSKLAGTSSLEWTERGPGNVSGRTRGLIVDPDDATNNTWFAGSVGGGVWKTIDAGDNWTNLTPDLPNLAVGWMVMAPSNHNIIYVGTGEGYFNIDQINGTGIWRSTDRGYTWTQQTSPGAFEFHNVTRMIVHPTEPDIVLVSANVGSFGSASATSGIFRSTDGGVNWKRVYSADAVDQIIANPDNFNTQYATVNSVGVVKSLDGGLTWADASEGIGAVGRMELAIAPSDPLKLYLAAEGGASGSVLYASVDGGTNWVLGSNEISDINWLGTQGWYDNTIAVNPFDANEVFVGGQALIMKINMGTEIDTTAFQATGVDEVGTSSFFSFQPFINEDVATGIMYGDLYTTDPSQYTTVQIRFGPGVSQKAHQFFVPLVDGVSVGSGVADADYTYQNYVDVPFEVYDIDDPNNERQLMVSFRDQTLNGLWELEEYAITPREYIFISNETYHATESSATLATPGGHAINQLYMIWPVLADGATFDAANLPTSTLTINWGRLITTSIASTIITDGYRDFGGDPKGVHVDHHNIVLVPDGVTDTTFRLVNANDGGVAYSDDAGETFDQPLNGYNTSQFYGVDKKNGADEYIGGMQDNGTWRSPSGVDADAASAWTPEIGGDGFESVWHYTHPDSMLGGSQFNGLRRSLDGGTSWSSAINGLNEIEDGSPFITKLAKSKQDPDLIFAVGTSGVWRTDNFASNWTLTEMPAGWVGNSSMSDVKISLANPQIVWAGNSMVTGSPIYVSQDGGLSFVPTAVYPTAEPLGSITGIETHPTEESTAFALFSFADAPKILRTKDLGQTWTELSGFGSGVERNGFPDVAVYSLLVMPTTPDTIWAGTEIGIFESDDGGLNWAPLAGEFPPVAVWEMVVVNDQVVVATHGRGIWTATITELAGYEPAVAILSPRLNSLAGGAGGIINATVGLKSPYDSSFVMVDGVAAYEFAANAVPVDSAINFNLSVSAVKTSAFSVVAYKDGIAYRSGEIDLQVFPLLTAQESYTNDFNVATTDFVLNGFTVSTETNFLNGGLHSLHPYPDQTELTATLTTPIKITAEHASIFSSNVPDSLKCRRNRTPPSM